MYETSSSTTSNGYVIVAFDFDAYDSTPTKQEMLTWKYSARGPLWAPVRLDVSVDSRISTYRYCDYEVRGDKRLDLLGNLFYLVDSTGGLSAGELYVEYSCHFR